MNTYHYYKTKFTKADNKKTKTKTNSETKKRSCYERLKIVSGSLEQDAIEDSMYYYLQIPEACKTKCAFGILRKLNDFREI